MLSLTSAARQLLDICLLRAAPQQLPFSWELLGLTVIASIGLGYPALQIYDATSNPVPELMLSLVFTLGFVYGVLVFRGVRIRFVQTASAIFGTDAIITLAALPVLHAASGGATHDSLVQLAMAGVWIWNLMVLGHILRHALSLPLPGGILVAMSYFFGSVFLSQLIHA